MAIQEAFNSACDGQWAYGWSVWKPARPGEPAELVEFGVTPPPRPGARALIRRAFGGTRRSRTWNPANPNASAQLTVLLGIAELHNRSRARGAEASVVDPRAQGGSLHHVCWDVLDPRADPEYIAAMCRHYSGLLASADTIRAALRHAHVDTTRHHPAGTPARTCQQHSPTPPNEQGPHDRWCS